MSNLQEGLMACLSRTNQDSGKLAHLGGEREKHAERCSLLLLRHI